MRTSSAPGDNWGSTSNPHNPLTLQLNVSLYMSVYINCSWVDSSFISTPLLSSYEVRVSNFIELSLQCRPACGHQARSYRGNCPQKLSPKPVCCPQLLLYVGLHVTRAPHCISRSSHITYGAIWRRFCFRNVRCTFWFPQKQPKWLPPDIFPWLKMYQNAFAAAAPLQTHGKFTAPIGPHELDGRDGTGSS